MRLLKSLSITIAVCVAPICALADNTDPPPESSRILRLSETPESGSADHIDLSGYARPDMVGYIYDGRFGFVPGNGLDNIRYYVQLVSDLTKKCPNLKLEDHKDEIIPYAISGVTDLVTRFQKGTLSSSEMLQAIWIAILTYNENSACQYDPSKMISLDQAQENCNAAGSATREFSVLPSLSASADINLFLRAHSCYSSEAHKFANNLIAFGREAPAISAFTNQMPSPDSALGRDYVRIFDNCARSSMDAATQRWCGCYVHTLSSLSPDIKVLNGLANNPFVDGRTYMSWVTRNVPGGDQLYKCADSIPNLYSFREGRAPRPTACLIERSPSDSQCRYRAAWGEFSVAQQDCVPAITSKSWGWREVDCGAGGAPAAISAAPRQWKRGAIRMIDYEQDVAPDFVPQLPDDAKKNWPVYVRLLRRTTPGRLKQISIAKIGPVELDLPFNLAVGNKDVDRTLSALFKQDSFILSCGYVRLGSGTHTDIYWYRDMPKDVEDGNVAHELIPFLSRVKAPREACPANLPG